MKRIYLYIILILFSGKLLFAQEILTVEQAVSIALENNYGIKIAKNTARQSANNASIGNAGMLPTLTAGASYLQGLSSIDETSSSEVQNNIPTAENSSLNGNISLNWTVFDGLKMFSSYSKYKELAELGEETARLTIEQSIVEVMENYYAIISYQQQMLSYQHSLAVSRARMEEINDKYEIGSASKLDVLNAQVDYHSDTSAYLRAKEIVLSSKVRLNQLLTRDVSSFFEVEENIEMDEPLLFDSIRNKALQQNVYLSMARIQQNVAEKTLKEVNAAYFPTISLNAGYDYGQYQYNYGMTKSRTSSGFSYGATASINLFNGFNKNRQHKNAKIERENAAYSYEQTLLSIEADIRTQFINYEINKQMLDLESDNLETAKQNMDISLERYKLGSLSSLELREAQRNYISAITRYTNALYSAKISEIVLKQMAGEILAK